MKVVSVSLDIRRKFLIVAAASMVVVAQSAVCQAGGSTLGATPAAAASRAGAPMFAVASIRVNKTATDGQTHVYQHQESGEFLAINISLKDLLKYAYALPDNQIVGTPGWSDSEHFDIEAKSDHSVDEQIHKLSSDLAKTEKQRMVRALLAERFGLAAHAETRELPVYELVVAKGGSKVPVAKGNGTDIGLSRDHVDDRGCAMAVLADQLARVVGRVVVDKTGMAGRFDFALRWMPDNAAAANTEGVSIFTAVQEQLGLKLESAKAPVGLLVVDHVEMPSAN